MSDVPYRDDHGLIGLLDHFGIGPTSLLGHGGEAWVFAYGTDLVLRVLHPGGQLEHVRRSHALIAELSCGPREYDLPQLVDVGELAGRVFAIERRLRGRSVLDVLTASAGPARTCLIEAYLETADALGDLHLETRGGFGDLLCDDPVTATSWRSYLAERAARNMARSTLDLGSIDPDALAAALPEAEEASFVHLDLYPGNMLTDGSSITAVLDFGATCVVGDRRLDPLSAVVYLEAPEISSSVRTEDVDVARRWLRSSGLQQWLEPARRWLAAYWSFAVNDPKVLDWSARILVESR